MLYAPYFTFPSGITVSGIISKYFSISSSVLIVSSVINKNVNTANTKTIPPSAPNIVFFLRLGELLNLGVMDYKLDSGNIIRVYDLDKTICDIIKNKKKFDSVLFNKAIREYFYSKKKNTLKLYEYAKKMNIYNKVRDTFEVLK